jgi:hypothetical protein
VIIKSNQILCLFSDVAERATGSGRAFGWMGDGSDAAGKGSVEIAGVAIGARADASSESDDSQLRREADVHQVGLANYRDNCIGNTFIQLMYHCDR